MLELVLGLLETTEAEELEAATATLADTVRELESTEVENEYTELAPFEFEVTDDDEVAGVDDEEEDEKVYSEAPDVLDVALVGVVRDIPDPENKTIVVVAGTLGTVTAQNSVTDEVGLMLMTTLTDGGASVIE